MKRVHIIGRKNSGKTTLVAELISAFAAQGMCVGGIKHTHHHHELDVPGKDSFRHRQAGAAVVGIITPGMVAAFRPQTRAEGTEAAYAALAPMFAGCHLVLVEGDSRTAAPKIEVWRQATGQAPLCAEDPAILGVITDDPLPVVAKTWPRSDLDQARREIRRLLED